MQWSVAVKPTRRLKTLALLVSLFLSTTVMASDNSRHYRLNIPSQNIELALRQLADKTNSQLLFPYAPVETLKSNSVSGRYTLNRALTIILKGTPLSGELTEDGVIVITHRQNNSENKGMDSMNRKKTLLAATVAFFAAGGVYGETDVGGGVEGGEMDWLLEEIVVTAQKREERLIDVPISIAAFDENKINDLGIKSLNDLSYAVPNLSMQSVDENFHFISIRGVSNSEGKSPLTGIYLDEIPLSVSTGVQANVDPSDIQRVEVLRGPQGTLYGQGSMGGTIRMITNSPVFNEAGGSVMASASSVKDGGSGSKVEAIANIPLIDDEMAVRVVANYKDIGGWIDQPDSGKEDVNDTQASYIRMRGLWQPSDALDVSGMAIRYRSDSGGRNEANIRINNGTPFYRVIERNGSPLLGSDIEYENDIYNLTFNYDFGFATLTSSSSQFEISSFIESSSNNVSQIQELNEGVINIGLYEEIDVFSQEFRLASNESSGPVEWVIGLYYSDLKSLSGGADSSFYSGGVSPGIFGPYSLERTSESNAIFANVGYDLSEKLTLTFGGRYFEDDRSLDYPRFSTSMNASFDHFSPMISLAYALNEDANLYASIAEGFRSGGFNNFIPTVNYEPESVRTYEIGAKASLLDNRLNMDGAVFFSEYSDYIARDTVLVDGVARSGLVNPGEVEIRGVEFSTQFNLSEQLSIGLNGHYTDAEFTKVSAGNPIFEVGDGINDMPKYSYSANARYEFDWFFNVPGLILVDYSEQGGQVWMNRLLPDFGLPGRFESGKIRRLNAQIAADWESFSVRLIGKNLTDEREFTKPPLFNAMFPHRPRTLSVELAYKF